VISSVLKGCCNCNTADLETRALEKLKVPNSTNGPYKDLVSQRLNDKNIYKNGRNVMNFIMSWIILLFLLKESFQYPIKLRFGVCAFQDPPLCSGTARSRSSSKFHILNFQGNQPKPTLHATQTSFEIFLFPFLSTQSKNHWNQNNKN
jgi:hypothetical protein